MLDIVRGNIPQYVPVKQTDIIKPSAYQNSTPPTHQKGAVNGLRNSSTGASLGSLLGPYGSFLGAAVGLGTDIWQAVYAKKRAKEANEQSAKAAQEQAARAHAESVSSREWNSEQQQIRRMRMAGLSPGLMYGQMSPSSAQQASPEQQQIHKADTPKFDNESLLRALELLVKQQQADTAQAAQESAANLQGTQADLNRIEQGYKAQLGLANIASLLSSKELTDQQKLNLIAKQLPEIELLQSQATAATANARQANATANVVEQTGVNLANSEVARNNASANLANAQKNHAILNYNIDESQWLTVQKFMKEYNLGEELAPLVMKALSSLANNTGQSIASLIQGLGRGVSSIIDGIFDLIPMPEYEEYTETEKSGSRSKHGYDEQTTTRRGRRKK